jgi:hypothetical protein
MHTPSRPPVPAPGRIPVVAGGICREKEGPTKSSLLRGVRQDCGGFTSGRAMLATRAVEDRGFSLAMVPVALVLPASCVPRAATAFVLGHDKPARSASAAHDVCSFRRGHAASYLPLDRPARSRLVQRELQGRPSPPPLRDSGSHDRAAGTVGRTLFVLDATANASQILCASTFVH